MHAHTHTHMHAQVVSSSVVHREPTSAAAAAGAPSQQPPQLPQEQTDAVNGVPHDQSQPQPQRDDAQGSNAGDDWGDLSEEECLKVGRWASRGGIYAVRMISIPQGMVCWGVGVSSLLWGSIRKDVGVCVVMLLKHERTQGHSVGIAVFAITPNYVFGF